MAGSDDYVQGSDGQWYDPNETPPPGVSLNTSGPRWNAPPQAQPAPTPRPITTPNSSTGQPAYADPSAPQTQFATSQGGPLTTTPNSRTGAPAPGIRTVPPTRNLPAVRPGVPMPTQPTANPMTMPGLPLGGALATGVDALANAPTTDQGVYNNANSFNDWFDSTRVGKALNWATGHNAPRWGSAAQTAPAAYSPSPIASPVTAPGAAPQMGMPAPPNIPPPPTGPGISATIPPFNVSPRPAFQSAPPPRGAAPRAPSSINLGYGAPAAAAPPAAPNPMFTGIDRPNADIVGGPTVPGQLSAAPREPGGPARMGALDLSGLFNHPAVAAAAAQHPAVQGALAAQNAAPNMDNAMLGMSIQNAGLTGGGGGARAPMVQPRNVGNFGAGTNQYGTPNRWNPFAQFGTPT
jgi:hypothetical protein